MLFFQILFNRVNTIYIPNVTTVKSMVNFELFSIDKIVKTILNFNFPLLYIFFCLFSYFKKMSITFDLIDWIWQKMCEIFFYWSDRLKMQQNVYFKINAQSIFKGLTSSFFINLKTKKILDFDYFETTEQEPILKNKHSL